MSAASATPPGGLPTYAGGSKALGWWGILLLVLIELAVFSTLIVTYFYLYSGASVWPPEGIDPPKLTLPAINAVVLFTSFVPAYMADRAIRRGDVNGLRIGYAIGSALLVLFLVLKYIEYSGYDYFWDTNAYGSIVWTITGFHSGHVMVILLKTIVLSVLAWKGFFNQKRYSAIQGNTLYWFFLAAIWVPLFATLYIFPRLI